MRRCDLGGIFALPGAQRASYARRNGGDDQRPWTGSVLKLIVFSPDTPPRKVAEITEPLLGHLEVFR